MGLVVLYILGILIIVVGLALSIGLHEVGHLVPAKLFGVRVSRYMIGFGPTVFSFRRGETEYGFKALPLGGYMLDGRHVPAGREGGRARSATTGVFKRWSRMPAPPVLTRSSMSTPSAPSTRSPSGNA